MKVLSLTNEGTLNNPCLPAVKRGALSAADADADRCTTPKTRCNPSNNKCQCLPHHIQYKNRCLSQSKSKIWKLSCAYRHIGPRHLRREGFAGKIRRCFRRSDEQMDSIAPICPSGVENIVEFSMSKVTGTIRRFDAFRHDEHSLRHHRHEKIESSASRGVENIVEFFPRNFRVESDGGFRHVELRLPEITLFEVFSYLIFIFPN